MAGKRFSSDTMLVIPLGRKYQWGVWPAGQPEAWPIGAGECHTYDDAFRAARNFIRHNQNVVYGDCSTGRALRNAVLAA